MGSRIVTSSEPEKQQRKKRHYTGYCKWTYRRQQLLNRQFFPAQKDNCSKEPLQGWDTADWLGQTTQKMANYFKLNTEMELK